MKTKIVYVLTCAPEATYIEQALISVWSVRYYNPDAHIVLLTVDQTDELLAGKRGELLEFISEKIVIPFEDDKKAHYRSRWLKTSVRELLVGDYLFIDCDTIVMRDLSSIEQVDADIAMVRDENIDIADEVESATKPMVDGCGLVGVDILKEKHYFNSGVMFVRECEANHDLYRKWHEFWLEGVQKGVNLDQPTFAKANISCGRPVVLLEDKWNTIAFSQIKDIYNGPYILHFWHGVSFLYNESALVSIRKHGLTSIIKYYILHPTETFIPFDNRISHYGAKDYWRFYTILKRVLRDYSTHIDSSFSDFESVNGFYSLIKKAVIHHLFSFASFFIVLQKIYLIKMSGKFIYKENYYRK